MSKYPGSLENPGNGPDYDADEDWAAAKAMKRHIPGHMPLADASRQIGAHAREIGRLREINADLLEALEKIQAIVRQPDHAEHYTMDDLNMAFSAFRQITVAAIAKAQPDTGDR